MYASRRPGAHARAHVQVSGQRAERVGEDVGGVAAGPRREPVADVGVDEPAVAAMVEVGLGHVELRHVGQCWWSGVGRQAGRRRPRTRRSGSLPA